MKFIFNLIWFFALIFLLVMKHAEEKDRESMRTVITIGYIVFVIISIFQFSLLKLIIFAILWVVGAGRLAWVISNIVKNRKDM